MNNKHNFTKDVAGRGANIWCFLGRGHWSITSHRYRQPNQNNRETQHVTRRNQGETDPSGKLHRTTSQTSKPRTGNDRVQHLSVRKLITQVTANIYQQQLLPFLPYNTSQKKPANNCLDICPTRFTLRLNVRDV